MSLSTQRAVLESRPADAELISAIESILLVADGPVSLKTLARVTGQSLGLIAIQVDHLDATLTSGIRLQRLGDEIQLATSPENAEVVQRYLGAAKPAPLSRPSLEALTVVAYRQPVTRSEVESARGVNSDRALQTLQARGLIEEKGVRQTLGRPMQFGTTFAFLEYFGLKSLADLPPIARHDQIRDASILGMRNTPIDANTGECGPQV